ncbi:MAG: peptidoglycan DD-metalloendopeptidase family protein [bacterium]|nr:peptidoglycan DD-metalloendopeptidase family protein [bacterium]
MEGCLQLMRTLVRMGGPLAAVAHALGLIVVRGAVPFYRAWWTFRRMTLRRKMHVAELLAAVLTNRSFVTVAFAGVLLIVAGQSTYAHTYGGFVGERPLLRAFIAGEEPELVEELVAGPAARTVEPTFRAASVRALTPTVLGAEVTLAAVPQTSGYALMQPVLTDTAVEDHGRKGVTTYTVELGDTPSTIAERFGIRTSTVLWANTLSAWSLIRPGQTLKILPTDGVLHTVKRGDTLEKISKHYSADAEEVLEFNRLVDADDIEAGDTLIIIGGRPYQAPAPVVTTPVKKAEQKPLPSIPGKFFWPSISEYRISQYYHWAHHGIDVAVNYGTSIYASDPGTVVSAGWLGGYGYQVTIDHGNGLETRYAHSSKLLVSKGQQVERGQELAKVGSTGRSTGPHIHYEVYANNVRVNPFQYLR